MELFHTLGPTRPTRPTLLYHVKTQGSVTRMVHRLQDLENLQSSSNPPPRTPICVAKQVI